MGTRNLVAVVSNGKPKVAQYGQWDGYPSGQGETVLKFILKEMDFDKFKKSVDECTWITEEELESIDKEKWEETHGYLSRDFGAKILGIVQDKPRALKNSWDFAADSLFCEFAYVLDLDKKQLEVYTGFNKEAVSDDSRFATLPLEKPDGDYKHVRLLKKYPFSELTENTMRDLEKELDSEE